MCARHIYANFRKTHTGTQLKALFWAAAKSGTPQEFDYHIGKINEISEAAAQYLLAHHPESWSRAFFSYNSSCEAVDNNMAETFNSTIIEARGKPIIDMFEDLRMYAIKRMQRKRNDSLKWEDELCPKARAKLEKAKDEHCSWEVLFLGETKFEVSCGRQRYGVNLNPNEKTGECKCRQWNLSGMPCKHSVAAILWLQDDPDKYVAKWFRVETFKKSYSYFMQPVNGEKLWIKTNGQEIKPPMDRRMPGRPKKNRRKDASEEPKKAKNSNQISRKGRVMHCKRCGKPGHNVGTCKTPESELPAKNNMPGSKRGTYFRPGVNIEHIVSAQATSSTQKSSQGSTSSAPAPTTSSIATKPLKTTSTPKSPVTKSKVAKNPPTSPNTRSKQARNAPTSPITRSKSNGTTLGLKRKWI
ncbi:hypothetical protein ACHQM5_020261 [Ranunculus cassubicifolius]